MTPVFFALSAEDQPMLVYMIIIGLIALGPAIHSWIKVWQFFRGQSPDLAQYVTHDHLSQIKAERDKQIAETIAAIRQDMASFKHDLKKDLESFESQAGDLQKEMMSLHRSLGRVEGHDEAETRRRPR